MPQNLISKIIIYGTVIDKTQRVPGIYVRVIKNINVEHSATHCV